MTILSLADLSVGRRFQGGSRTVMAEEIKAFASDYDPQPFHTDEEAATGSFFGGLAASGWHTAALTMRLVVETFRLRNGVIGGGGEILWPKAVRPGDTLSVEIEILEIVPSRSRPGRASVFVQILTRNQHGEVVQSFKPKLVVTE